MEEAGSLWRGRLVRPMGMRSNEVLQQAAAKANAAYRTGEESLKLGYIALVTMGSTTDRMMKAAV